MPENIEMYQSPDGRMLHIDHVTGEVWATRYVAWEEKTELLKAARKWSERARVKLVKDEEEEVAPDHATRSLDVHVSPERDRVVHVERDGGRVWLRRLVTSESERTELVNAARASWEPRGSNSKASRGGLSAVR